MLTRSRRLPAVLPFLALMLLWTGCGIGEIGDDAPWDDDDPERETMFKHPPPSTPAPWTYGLTSYGGPSDSSAYLHSVACGGKKPDGKWWYSTGAWSFGCFSRLELCANGKCVVVKVVDNGPAGWVESKAKSKCGGTGYIIDASPLVSKYLHGKSSAGWSDCLKIKVRPVAGNTPTGPSSGTSPSPGSGDCHTGQKFGWEYCSPSCRCGKGMGDCDSDADCTDGLQCAHNVGAAYGAGGTVDVCEEQPGSSGDNNSYGDCYYGGELGTCQPDNLPCSGSYKGSLCPGANNIRCCMPPSNSGDNSGDNSTYGSCTYSGKTGTCQSTGVSCDGGYKRFLCPGGNDIQCCLPTWGSCSSGGQTGTCQLTSQSCSTGYKSGLCPGPNDVKCCL
jgi:hypothetical protein